MKKEFIEYLGFEEDEKPKVGRPKLADKETKKKSIIIASVSFFTALTFMLVGISPLVGFDPIKLTGNANNITTENSLITEIKPLLKDITLKENTSRKLYLTVTPASGKENIIYKSSDEDVVIVDDEGIITGISEGEAIVLAYATDGSKEEAEFNVKVIKNAEGKCQFTELTKTTEGLNYTIKCDNAKVKEIQFKTGSGNYETLLTKKLSDVVKLSEKQIKDNLVFKVVYYPNNSSISKYSTRKYTYEAPKETPKGSCKLSLDKVGTSSARYDIECENATVSKIAYKIGDGSYVGIDSSNLANTLIYEESEVTRVLYFNIEYVIDGTNIVKSVTESSIIQKNNSVHISQ